MNAKNIPAEGWTEPDERGHISYVTHAPAHSTDAPKRDREVFIARAKERAKIRYGRVEA